MDREVRSIYIKIKKEKKRYIYIFLFYNAFKKFHEEIP